MSVAYSRNKNLFLLMLALCLSSLAGCCKPCIRPVLHLETHPALHRVDLYPPGAPAAEYCLSDAGRRDVLTDLELYRASLESCREAVRRYNDEVKERGDGLP